MENVMVSNQRGRGLMKRVCLMLNVFASGFNVKFFNDVGFRVNHKIYIISKLKKKFSILFE